MQPTLDWSPSLVAFLLLDVLLIAFLTLDGLLKRKVSMSKHSPTRLSLLQDAGIDVEQGRIAAFFHPYWLDPAWFMFHSQH